MSRAIVVEYHLVEAESVEVLNRIVKSRIERKEGWQPLKAPFCSVVGYQLKFYQAMVRSDW